MLDQVNNISKYFKLFSSTFTFQGLIQLIGMLIGFYIVRQLSVQEYAYYTIANTVLGMMAVISNCGITISMYSQGAKVWQNKKELGSLLVGCIKFRHKIALLSFLICTPILVLMLKEQGANFLTIIIIILTIIPAFLATLTDSLYEIVPKLHQELLPLQKNQFYVSVLRFLLTGILLILFPFTWIALLANGLPRIYGNFKLKRIVKKNADLSQLENKIYDNETYRIVKRFAPGAIYYAFSGQIVIFILSFAANFHDTAAWGALGRYAIIFTIFFTAIEMILIPRYAKKNNDKKTLVLFSTKIFFIVAFLGGIVVIPFYIFTDFFLLILGVDYIGYKNELILVILNSYLVLLSGIVLNFSIARGWIINPFVDLFFNFLPLILFIFLINLNNLFNILIYTLLCSIFLLIFRYICFIYLLKVNSLNFEN